MNVLQTFLPMDRCQALVRGENLPEQTWGCALFADISSFTPFAESLVNRLEPQRGAEELSHQLERVYAALLHRFMITTAAWWTLSAMRSPVGLMVTTAGGR